MTDEITTRQLTELEKASVDFFKAVLSAGRQIIGSTEFQFRIDAMIAARTEDSDRAKILGARIQQALDVAKAVATPPQIEGVSVQ